MLLASNKDFARVEFKEIEGKLSNSQIIDVTKLQNNGKVIFGATVVLLNTATEEGNLPNCW